MILTHNELTKLVNDGAIEGVKPEQINGASIDLTLGDVFWLEDRPATAHPVRLGKKEVPLMREVTGGLHLLPGEFCLAQTREVFHLPDDIAAHYMLKSSLARAGLQHLFAGFADPTWNGSVLTLEYVNQLRHHSLVLEPGMKCGQMVFFRGTSPVPAEHSYARVGQYNGDTKAQPSKGAR